MLFAIATLFIIRALDIMQKFLFLCVCSVMLFSLYEIYGLRRKLDLITVYVCDML